MCFFKWENKPNGWPFLPNWKIFASVESQSQQCGKYRSGYKSISKTVSIASNRPCCGFFHAKNGKIKSVYLNRSHYETLNSTTKKRSLHCFCQNRNEHIRFNINNFKCSPKPINSFANSIENSTEKKEKWRFSPTPKIFCFEFSMAKPNPLVLLNLV